jgi:hypothetical protein
MEVRLRLRTCGTILVTSVPLVLARRVMLGKDRRLPVLFGRHDRRSAIATGQDIVVSSFPSVTIVAGEALLIATIELMPSLAGPNPLPHLVLAVREGRATGETEDKGERTPRTSMNYLVPHGRDSCFSMDNRSYSSGLCSCQYQLM